MNGVGDTKRGATERPGAVFLDASALRSLLLVAFESLQARSESLSELDRAIGDGDHGTTVSRAAVRVRQLLTGETPPDSIGAILRGVGGVFLDLDGGATGPLFGTFFTGMSKAAGDHDHLDPSSLASLFEGGLEAVRGLTRAVPGDKTLMDALVPAVDAVTASAERGGSVATALDAGAAAAEAGASATVDLRARHGRAKHLGERVVGHEDPGARTVAILFRGLAAGWTNILTTEE